MIKDKFEYASLIRKLNEASDNYYNTSTPIMSDAEFDEQLYRIKEFEDRTGIVFSNSPTNKVGATVLKELKKIDITPTPMLSLNKCHTIKEVEEFKGDHAVCVSVKADGLSVRLKYENGKLLSANTRGNGYVGSDITEHVKQFTNIPLSIDNKNSIIIDGEAVILKYNFNSEEFANPRNAAAGALNVLDTKETKKRKLSFIAWELISPKEETYHQGLDLIESLGFFAIPYALYDDSDYDKLSEINNIIVGYANKYGIPSDGVVYKFDNIKYGESLGATGHHFKSGIAWKPAIVTANSILRDIEWSMGRTGQLTPVAIFDPVDISGTIIERANLHNVTIMNQTLGVPYVGQKIKIYKANEIIPQILNGSKIKENDKKIEIPSICPICGEELKLSSGILLCVNPNCQGKLINVIDHYCGKKGMNILGISKKTLEKLISWGWINSISDIYKLSAHRDEWINKEGWGDASVDKILSAIEESKYVTDEVFVAALGIPLIGTTQSKQIFKDHVKNYQEFRDLINEKFNFFEWDGFGSEKTSALWNYDYTEADSIHSNYLIIKNTVKITVPLESKIKDKVFCITGSLEQYKNRDALKEEIESKGGKVSSSVTSKTNILINNDIESTSAKNKKAKDLGIPIITEQNFIDDYIAQK